MISELSPHPHLTGGSPKLTLADRQSWTPLIPQYVQTDRTVGVNIRVIDLGEERYLGWFEWVV